MKLKTLIISILLMMEMYLPLQGIPMEFVKERMKESSEDQAQISRKEKNLSSIEDLTGVVDEEGSQTTEESWTKSGSSMGEKIDYDPDEEVPISLEHLINEAKSYRESAKKAVLLNQQETAKRNNQAADWLYEASTKWFPEFSKHSQETKDAEEQNVGNLTTACINLSAKEHTIIKTLIEFAKDLTADNNKNWDELERSLEEQRNSIAILEKEYGEEKYFRYSRDLQLKSKNNLDNIPLFLKNISRLSDKLPTKIAIVDTGIYDYDLAGDHNGHGTHVAGIIERTANKFSEVEFIDCKIHDMGRRAFSANKIAESINEACQQGANIINLGFNVLDNFHGTRRFLIHAIMRAAKNSILIISAGNKSHNLDNQSEIKNLLERLPQVVTVAAVAAKNDDLMPWSNYGQKSVHLAAPGENIFTTFQNNYHGVASGTSMAAAHVSGALAVMMAQFPTLDKQQIVKALCEGCDRNPNLEGKVKYGKLNLMGALKVCARYQEEEIFKRAQENYAAACSLEESARNSFCQEAIALWEEAIQKVQEAHGNYEELLVKRRGALPAEQKDVFCAITAKTAYYKAQRANCISAVIQGKASDASAGTQEKLDFWKEAVQKATDAKDAWVEAEKIFKNYLDEATESTKDWWAKEYDGVICAKNNAIEMLHFCQDGKEELVLSPFNSPSEGECRRLRVNKVVEHMIVDGPKQSQQTQLRILKKDLLDDFIRTEEIFDKITKIVFEKKEMVGNVLSVSLKKEADPLKILIQLSPVAKAIDFLLDDEKEPWYSLYLNKPFLSSWQNVIDDIRKEKLPVVDMEPKFLRHRSALPNDPDYREKKQWSLLSHSESFNSIDAPRGWEVRSDAPNVPIAVLDSGVFFEHEDLQDLLTGVSSSQQFNAYNKIKRPSDHEGHGTHLAGIIAADSDNNIGITGIIRGRNAKKNKIIICKTPCEVNVESINFAAKHAKIVNCSFNDPNFSKTEYSALKSAIDKKYVIIVASAGNSKGGGQKLDNIPSYPACYSVDQVVNGKLYNKLENIIIVAATNTSGQLRESSNYGDCVHIAAPGENIYSTWHEKDEDGRPYNIQSGTSQAAAHVTGALALMMEEFPYLSATQLIDRLLKTADKPLVAAEENSRKTIQGGRLNLARALGHLDTIAPNKMQEWVSRLESEAKTANLWVEEVAKKAWKTTDEKLWQEAINRIVYAEQAWQKVSEACQRNLQSDQDEGIKVDGQPNERQPREETWREKQTNAQENKTSWKARRFLYKAKQAKNKFFNDATKSLSITDRLQKLREAEQAWSEMLEIYSKKMQESPEQESLNQELNSAQQSWMKKLNSLLEQTPNWNEEIIKIK